MCKKINWTWDIWNKAVSSLGLLRWCCREFRCAGGSRDSCSALPREYINIRSQIWHAHILLRTNVSGAHHCRRAQGKGVATDLSSNWQKEALSWKTLCIFVGVIKAASALTSVKSKMASAVYSQQFHNSKIAIAYCTVCCTLVVILKKFSLLHKLQY